MPAGFYVLNDAGTILINDANPSLALRKKQSVVTAAAAFAAVTLTSAEYPCLAIACNTSSFLNSATWSGTTVTFNCRSAANAVDGIAANMYIYDRPVAAANSGLRVYDAAGNITFDALGKYGRYAGARTSNGTFTGTSGRSYAGTILSSIYKDEILIDPIDSAYRLRRVSVTGVRATSNLLIVADTVLSEVRYPSSDTPGVITSRGSVKVLITDVTGY